MYRSYIVNMNEICEQKLFIYFFHGNSPIYAMDIHTIKSFGNNYLHNKEYNPRAWMAKFGASPETCLILWSFIVLAASVQLVQPIHLLWLLYWLKVYPTWDEFSSTIGVDRKTARQKVYLTLSVAYKTLSATSIV